MTAGSPACSTRPSASRISRDPTPMRWQSGRTDIGVRLRILARDPPSTQTQLQHHVSNHTGGVLGDQRQLRNELLRRPNTLDEQRDLVWVPDERRANRLCDHAIVRVALRTDDDAPGATVAMIVGATPSELPAATERTTSARGERVPPGSSAPRASGDRSRRRCSGPTARRCRAIPVLLRTTRAPELSTPNAGPSRTR